MHSLIEIANQINKEKLSVFELSVLYNEIPENYKKDLILPFLSIENNMIKISARIKDSEKIKRKELIDEINNYLETQFDNIEEFHVNGLLVLYNNMLQSLFGSQIKSFGIILLSIFVMFIILFQSVFKSNLLPKRFRFPQNIFFARRLRIWPKPRLFSLTFFFTINSTDNRRNC